VELTAVQKLLAYDAMAAHVTVLDQEATELRARVAQLEAAATAVTECEDDLEDAVLALRDVLKSR
jgi:prefoldin subunit 5